MRSKKAIRAVSAIVAAWALLVSAPAAPASAAGQHDRPAQLKKDSGWDIP